MHTKMDQIEYEKLQAIDKFIKYEFLKKTLQFLIPISIFSVILFYSSGLSFIHHSMNFYFRTFLFPLVTHTLERKYMFLICNGILAFLARNLGLGSSSDVGSDLGKDHEDGEMVASSEMKPSAVAEDEQEEEQKEEGNVAHAAAEEEEGSLNTEVENRKSRVLVMEDEDREEEAEEEIEKEEENRSLVAAEAGVEENEEGNEECLHTEELNKKFDEFIRRMKEELRLQAQQQLIVV